MILSKVLSETTTPDRRGTAMKSHLVFALALFLEAFGFTVIYHQNHFIAIGALALAIGFSIKTDK